MHLLLPVSYLYIIFYYTLLVYFYLIITIFISKNFKTCTFIVQAHHPRLQKRAVPKIKKEKSQKQQKCNLYDISYQISTCLILVTL